MMVGYMILDKRKANMTSEFYKNFRLTNEFGFTLVELMVAVAIIGVLAALSSQTLARSQA